MADHKGTPVDLRYGSNAVRLSAGQWTAAGAILVAVFMLTPIAWEHAEPFQADADYRIPYDLSNDYWLFARYARRAAAERPTLVLGDSAIWGQYVTPHQTLPHYLNEQAGGERFANLGVDGAHPVALAGLVEYYGRDIAGTNVILHCNLLWTASKKHDLASEKEFPFNHPALVPQFVPRIPCYKETVSRRLGIVIDRYEPFAAWANHLCLAYFNKMDLPSWTMENPTANPLRAIRLELPPPDESPRHDPVPWTERGIGPQALAWVDLDTSLQWRFFRRAVETLRARGNRVFVLVGPFNEHMLDDKSREVYAERKRQVEAWLWHEQVPCCVPPPLPSELYADASHPLADGYALLARRLVEDNAFAQFRAAAQKAE